MNALMHQNGVSHNGVVSIVPPEFQSDNITTHKANGVLGKTNGSLGNISVSTNGSDSVVADAMNSTTEPDMLDIPMPTANGGFTHTKASRAKIGAANKGKTPWNKGQERPPEVRARIAAGVRAKNRERFLKKLEDMGLTEEEYEEQKKAERRKKDAERRARRTPKGGYIPTQETRQKISRILKEKYASGEIKPRSLDPSKVRRGFTHSEETRAKISESLKKRWANDPEYRQAMMEKAKNQTQTADYRDRIAETLRRKWKQPEFRAKMMEKIATRKPPSSGVNGESHREKISRAMKAKWQDAEYREKTLSAIAKRNGQIGEKPVRQRKMKTTVNNHNAPKENKVKGVAKSVPRGPRSIMEDGGVRPVEPVRQRTEKKAKKKKKKKVTKKKKKAATQKARARENGNGAQGAKSTVKKVDKEPDGSVNRLREERRDLFDLLYGDEEDILKSLDDDEDDNDDDYKRENIAGYSPLQSILSSPAFQLNDENLDTFDPYGLDDY